MQIKVNRKWLEEQGLKRREGIQIRMEQVATVNTLVKVTILFDMRCFIY